MSGADLLVLSPHLDDAALSCGGLIHARVRSGAQVRVATPFAGDLPEGLGEFAKATLERMGLQPEDASARRRKEDEVACRILGVELDHGDFTDAVARRGADGAVLYGGPEALLQEPSEDDAPLVGELADWFRGLGHFEQILAPLGVGGHVDHRLVRRAAEEAFPEGLRYYEDFPYVIRKQGPGLDAVLGDRRGWRSEVVKLGAADLKAKVRAIRAYRSQVSPLFGLGPIPGRFRVKGKVRRYAEERGGERIWARAVSGR